MQTPKLSPEFRLRSVALLLMSLPSLVAAACFAHGHGALGSYGLLALLAAAIAAGAAGAYLALKLLPSRKEMSSGLPVAAAVSNHL